MRVAFVASEAVPFIKVGGLADVVGALPAALKKLGVDVTVYLPWLAGVEAREVKGGAFVWGGRPETIRVAEKVHRGVKHRFVRLDGLGGTRPYEGEGDVARYTRFSLAVDALLARRPPDLVHVHDWHTALLPTLLSVRRSPVKSVLTIHNLAFQGLWDPTRFFQATHLPGTLLRLDGLEFHGQVNLLKGGVVFADALTTVSARYAEEIQSPAAGHGLDGVLRHYRDKLVGIQNGIDTRAWNPATDRLLPARFRAVASAGKAACRTTLRKRLGLSGTILGMVARLTHQKGVDIVLDALPELLRLGYSLVVLGSGEQELQARMEAAAAAHPGRVAYQPGYDEPLAHLIFAGADAFLVPSRWEPSGLTQLIAMRYGTPPIARATGGLADTIEDGVTGMLFESAHAEGLLYALCRLGHGAPPLAMGQAAMERDSSWEVPARRYLQLYQSLLGRKGGAA